MSTVRAHAPAVVDLALEVSTLTDSLTRKLVRGRPIVIGRGLDSDVRVDDTSVSRKHARLEVSDVVTAFDLGSRNGTRVAGVRAERERGIVVRPGQVLELGDTVVVLRDARALGWRERNDKPRSLVVGHGSRWFEPEHRPRTELGAGGVLARVMNHLVDVRLSRPGETVNVDQVFAAGWPDDAVSTKSRRSSMVFGALSRLWRLGLSDVVLPGNNGFVIDPQLRVLRVTETSDATE